MIKDIRGLTKLDLKDTAALIDRAPADFEISVPPGTIPAIEAMFAANGSTVVIAPLP